MSRRSICVHGDSPGAVAMAVAVRKALAEAGVEIRPVRAMTEHRTLLPCGEHAVLVEVGGLDEVLALPTPYGRRCGAGDGIHRRRRRRPGARTVLVVWPMRPAISRRCAELWPSLARAAAAGGGGSKRAEP